MQYLSKDFSISQGPIQNYLVKCLYKEDLQQNGWNFLRIEGNIEGGLLLQHQGAGFIEGYLTYKQIHAAYLNLKGAIIKSQTLSVQTQNFVNKQINYIDDMIKENKSDLYWQYAEAYLQQLRFMHKGYLSRVEKQQKPQYLLSFDQFYCLTNVGDLQDLIPAFHDSSQMGPAGNCNGYAKLINNQIYIAHSTHNIYSFLLRIFKVYHFPTKNEKVGSSWMAFSSRPGDLISKDDFYVLSSGLRVMETSFNNFKHENYSNLSPLTVPCWLRATIACNLCRNNKEWVEYFLQFRSGTHNNQWIIMDPRELKNKENVITFVEEGYELYEVLDLTPRFFKQGFIGSYNVPISEKIYQKMGYEKHGYTYENDPRAIVYAKYNQLISNVEDMKKWLIMNEEEDQKVGLAPRYDLASNNPSPFGLTDCKIIEPGKNQILAISGPSTSGGRFTAFNWQKWEDTPHFGMPVLWDFPWVSFPLPG